ncbi:MAG: hypothetical protein Roseis2KO_34180 [Roseivirga sp.]
MSACAKPKICGLGLYDYTCDHLDNINGKILEFDNSARMDTVLAHIQVEVLETYRESEREGIVGATVFVQNINVDSLRQGNVTDFEGMTDFYVEPGDYDLYISFIGYNTLIVQSLSLKSGMVMELKAVMGDGCGRNTFRLTDGNRLEEILPSQNSK